MTKIGKYKSLSAEKQEIQNYFIQVVQELEPKVSTDLPFESFQRITRNNLSNVEHRIFLDLSALIGKDNVTLKELLLIFPNADINTIEKDFAEFNRQMLIWAEKYCLKKDWIFRAACNGLENNLKQINKGQKSKLTLNGTLALTTKQPVEISIKDSWNSLQENFADYEHRVLQKLKEQKKQFNSKIKGYKQQTKPLDLQKKITWLVRWTVQNWTASTIAETECKTETERYVYYEIQKLKVFDLPVRTNKK